MLRLALAIFSGVAAYSAAVEGAPAWWVAAFALLALHFLLAWLDQAKKYKESHDAAPQRTKKCDRSTDAGTK